MQWDYIVVGAGSAGCAAVHHLVRTGKQVLLIEAGGDDRNLTVKLPFRLLRALDIFDWGYTCAPDDSRHRRSERWHRGKIVGGTSSVNGMIYVRGSRSDYDLWAAESDKSWSASNIMALFREMENCDSRSIASSPSERGYSGQLRVRMVKHPHRTSRAFVSSMIEKGYPFNSDYNASSQEGIGYTQLTQYKRMRFSAFDAFVRPHMGAQNLQIRSDCLVKKIDIENGRAVGVTVERDGVTSSIPAARVILSAGTINSPKILMLSGIGDSTELVRFGIDVKLDRKAVGRSLMDHPLVRIVYEMRTPTYAFNKNPFHISCLFLKYLFLGQGLLASPHEAMAFVRSSSGLAEPDLQLHFAPIGVTAAAADKTPRLMRKPSVFVSIKKNRPLSRGVVRLRSADPLEPPEIDANLLGNRADTQTIVRGINIVRDIMESQSIRDLVLCEVPDSSVCRSDDELRQFVTRNAIVACHPVGTCRMGSDPESVVDPDLRVRGVSNLWVADASIMPCNISGNTNAASMMIGYKLGKALVSTT